MIEDIIETAFVPCFHKEDNYGSSNENAVILIAIVSIFYQSKLLRDMITVT